ncbi:hypothetical protein [Donghicola eburneus]|uniref:Uncharacterized protein n=1 Tax=Donghicola eburneus TaxID=393278 RepID=A0A1M4N1L7_9RHOB|nr:hypothetical protein [Donghicola eburneus]SCM67875.1 hypothetical protein KARMA_2081 [Donghicola eburneus]SFQ54367.1 hypothetical protein SAMN05421764_105350 [Donghicola eburneus]
MSWIEKTWGSEKENQYKGFIGSFIALMLAFVVLVMMLFRLVGIGEQVLFYAQVYLMVLAGLALLASFKSWHMVSAVLSMFLFVELAVGYIPLALAMAGVPTRMETTFPVEEGDRYQFHPLLASLPVANYSAPTVSHNANHLRNNALPFDPAKPHVAVFGGSSTYDLGVSSDAATWVSQLDTLIPEYSVSNNGVPGYSSSEHVVQTTFYEDRAGTEPFCAVYYMGWNDIRDYGFDKLDNGYADFHLLSQYGAQKIRFSLGSPSPTLNLLAAYFMRNELPFPQAQGTVGKDVTADDDLFRVAERNVRSIAAINESRGIKTVFVAQMLNRARLTDPTRIYGWLPFVYDGDTWQLQDRFNKFVGNLAPDVGAGFIYPDIDAFSDEDFADNGHFNDQGSVKFSRMIRDDVVQMCGGTQTTAAANQ